MSIEATLAKNLAALMERHPDLNSQLRLSKVTGVGQTTVGRIRRADGAATIDNVQKIARAFQLEAWQLLDPTLTTTLNIKSSDPAVGMAARIASEVLASKLSENQLTILENTLRALKSK